MPPRKATAKRNKPTTTKAPTPAVDHEQPPPEVKTKTKSAVDLKAEEAVHETSIQEQASDPIPAGIAGESMTKEEVGLANRSVEDVNEEIEAVVGDGVVKEDLEESEDEDPEEEIPGDELDKDEDVDGFESEKNTEIVSAQEETFAAQVDNNNDGPVVNNADIKGTTEMVSMDESAQAVSTQTSYENNIAVAVEDDSMDYGESDDDSEGDDAGNGSGEDQDPSLIVQDSSPDNKKEKGTEIYVGKLDKNAVEDDLVSVFQQFGELKSTRVVRKPNSNKSKGFGFVRFASVDQAKRALSELKDGVEVKGKRVVISASQDNDTLYLGNICKTWSKEQVSQQLKDYGIENIEVLRVPEDPKLETKTKGFAFLEFSTHSEAVAAFQRLKKPDVFFGRDVSAKVAFAETPMHSKDEDLSQVNEVHLEGLNKDWNEEKVKDICKIYGEILKVNLCPGKRNKRKDFGFVIFDSPESARACVEGINNTAIEGEAKIIASIAKTQQKVRIQKQGIRGGFKVEKQSENSNKKSQPKSSKMKGVLTTQQTKTNKNKIKDNTVKPQQRGPHKKDGESSRGDNDPQQRNRKRKSFSEQRSSARDLGAPKKPNNGGRGHKRKNPSGNEAREDRGNRNAQGKMPFKKQRGNMRGRERDNDRRPRSDTHTRRGANSTRYAPQYAATASNAYHVASDHSLSTLRYKEMEPHAGYIEPAYAKPSGSYSGYAPPVVRTHPHQTVYLEPSSTSQSQGYTRYIDRPVMTQPYRDYPPPANVQIARDHYDPGHGRIVRHDDRGAGVYAYAGGQPYQASQVPNQTTYYQAGGSYSGAYGSRGAYY